MIYNKILVKLQEYIQYYLESVNFDIYESLDYSLQEAMPPSDIEDFIKNNCKPKFRQLLFNHIDKTGAIDSEICKKAGIDRKLFSKIRSNPDYRPGKNNIIALALELKEPEMDELLGSGGFSLSSCHSQKTLTGMR